MDAEIDSHRFSGILWLQVNFCYVGILPSTALDNIEIYFCCCVVVDFDNLACCCSVAEILTLESSKLFP